MENYLTQNKLWTLWSPQQTDFLYCI